MKLIEIIKRIRQFYIYNDMEVIAFNNKVYVGNKEFDSTDRDDFYVVNPSDTIEFVKWKLEHCDVIYLSGGSMKVLKFMLQSFGLWDILRKIEGKVIIGESAGSLMLQKTYVVFAENGLPNYYKGLDLVDTDIFVHYEKDNRTHILNFDTIRMFYDAYALPNNGGLIIEEDKVTKVGIVYE